MSRAMTAPVLRPYHEPSTGKSNDWLTPPEFFTALGLPFDLDPCSPGPGHWVPAEKIYTKADDGLRQPWFGRVFMNPPFGGRNGHVPWLIKFLNHGNGIAIVRAYTSSTWFHAYAVRAQTMLFPKGKTKFHRPDGTIGTAPGHGIVLLGMGKVCNAALRWSELGLFIDLRVQAESVREPPSAAAGASISRAICRGRHEH
jgi:hypothetical protein